VPQAKENRFFQQKSIAATSVFDFRFVFVVIAATNEVAD